MEDFRAIAALRTPDSEVACPACERKTCTGKKTNLYRYLRMLAPANLVGLLVGALASRSALR
jgi:hypothetical protein